jgi:hypothetical protein
MDHEILPDPSYAPFAVRDCALLSVATKLKAHDLREFRDGLVQVPATSLYYHFWGRLLRPAFDEPEYGNDFASWAYHGLGQKALAERLGIINPSVRPDFEAVRIEMVDVIEETLDEDPRAPWVRAEHPFHFVQAQMVIFDTGLSLPDPAALAASACDMPTSSVYYHFIDARRRTEDGHDDFSSWLSQWDPECLGVCAQLAALDPFFSSLSEIRRQVSVLMSPLLQDGR